MDDVTVLNNRYYPLTTYAGTMLGYECFISRELYSDHLDQVKKMLVDKIVSKFQRHNENKYVELSNEYKYNVVAIDSEGYEFRVTASCELVFI